MAWGDRPEVGRAVKVYVSNAADIGTGGSGGAVTVADGADVAVGALADAAVEGDNPGSLSAKLRGILKVLADLIQYEDQTHTNTDPGIQILAVRDDDFSGFAGADGDYAPLTVCQNGALHVCGSAVGQSAATYTCPLISLAGVVLDARPAADIIADNGEWGTLQLTQYGELRIRDDDLNTSLSSVISGSELQVDIVSVAVPETVYNGQNDVTTAGTREVLAGAQALKSGVTIKAKGDNTGDIYVGDSSVSSSNGFILDAGELVFIEVDNLSDVYIDSSVNGDGVSYIAS